MPGSHISRTAVLILLTCLSDVAGQAQATSSFDDLVEQASAAREQNDIPRAIELYSRIVQVNPKWPLGWWFLGWLQYQAGSFAAARDSLTHFIEVTPNPGPALGLRGLSELETGEYQQALEDIERSLSMREVGQPQNEQGLRFYEAVLLTRLGKFEDALRTYNFFVQRGVTSPELSSAIGLAGLRRKLLPKDVPEDQRDLVAAAGEALRKFMAGDENGAASAFQALFQHFPMALNAHYLYGYLLFTSDPYLAGAEFKRELEIAPSSENAQIAMAWALLMQNNAAAALPYARSAAAARPELAATELVLGRALSEVGELKEGIDNLEHALQQEPDNLEIHIALAKAYSRSGRTEEAHRERAVSLKLAPNGMTHIALP